MAKEHHIDFIPLKGSQDVFDAYQVYVNYVQNAMFNALAVPPHLLSNQKKIEPVDLERERMLDRLFESD